MATTVPSKIGSLPPIKFPSNDFWTIYSYERLTVFAQPKCTPFPLFIRIFIESEGGDQLGECCTYFPTYKLKYTTEAASDNSIQQILEVLSGEVPNFKKIYEALPFCSSSITITKSTGGISFESNSSFEDLLLSFSSLQNIWGFEDPASCRALDQKTFIEMPPQVSYSDLRIHCYLHDTVVLVTIADSKISDPDTLYVFKSNPIVRKLYQEIYTLSTLPPHPNVLQHPSFLVTKECVQSTPSRFSSGPNQSAMVVGFLAPYYPGGQLGSTISSRAEAKTLTISDQIRWAHQLTSALFHVFTHENGTDDKRCGLYTNLRLDNVILTSPEDGSNVILIDFEKGNNWIVYNAPEISQICERFPASGRPKPTKRYEDPKISHQNPFWTYSEQWEQEAAMVYTLGCCLWCIFGSQGCLNDPGTRWVKDKPSLSCEAISSASPRVRSIIENSISEAKKRPKLKEVLDTLGSEQGEGKYYKC